MDGIPTDVVQLLDTVAASARETLGPNLVGVYLRGSLATGGFDPETSDIDFLVVTEHPVTEAEFSALAVMHKRIKDLENPYAARLEGSYIDRESLKRFGPDDRRHPSIGTDWEFQWDDHRLNWIIERWVVRERGVVLVGPKPERLIDPIDADELRTAARSELQIRIDHWAGSDDIPDWLEPRYYQVFEVVTVCRALYTLVNGEAPSKPEAIKWALESLPKQWADLVRDTQAWRTDRSRDATKIPRIQQFVRWASTSAASDLR